MNFFLPVDMAGSERLGVCSSQSQQPSSRSWPQLTSEDERTPEDNGCNEDQNVQQSYRRMTSRSRSARYYHSGNSPFCNVPGVSKIVKFALVFHGQIFGQIARKYDFFAKDNRIQHKFDKKQLYECFFSEGIQVKRKTSFI